MSCEVVVGGHYLLGEKLVALCRRRGERVFLLPEVCRQMEVVVEMEEAFILE